MAKSSEVRALLSQIEEGDISAEQIEAQMKTLGIDAIVRVVSEVHLVLEPTPLSPGSIWHLPETNFRVPLGLYAAWGLFSEEGQLPKDECFSGLEKGCNVDGFSAADLRALFEREDVELVAGSLDEPAKKP